MDRRKELENSVKEAEATEQKLREQCTFLKSKLEEKEVAFERAKSEVAMNKEALKKFVEKNEILKSERALLEEQFEKWRTERELCCDDRDFGEISSLESRSRADQKEDILRKLEEKVKILSSQLQFSQYVNKMTRISSSSLSVLEAYIGNESCRRLLSLLNRSNSSNKNAPSILAAAEKNNPGDQENA